MIINYILWRLLTGSVFSQSAWTSVSVSGDADRPGDCCVILKEPILAYKNTQLRKKILYSPYFKSNSLIGFENSVFSRENRLPRRYVNYKHLSTRSTLIRSCKERTSWPEPFYDAFKCIFLYLPNILSIWPRISTPSVTNFDSIGTKKQNEIWKKILISFISLAFLIKNYAPLANICPKKFQNDFDDFLIFCAFSNDFRAFWSALDRFLCNLSYRLV